MTILKIDSSITGDNSVSRQLTEAVASQLRTRIPMLRSSSATSSRLRFRT